MYLVSFLLLFNDKQNIYITKSFQLLIIMRQCWKQKQKEKHVEANNFIEMYITA